MWKQWLKNFLTVVLTWTIVSACVAVSLLVFLSLRWIGCSDYNALAVGGLILAAITALVIIFRE